MKWILCDPKYGDVVRIKLASFYHYGIYVSDDEIIQFGLPPVTKEMLMAKDIKVLSSNIDKFLAGSFLEVAKLSFLEKRKAKSPKEVVEIARSKIGTGGYHILYNNCEHFVNQCLFGEKKSSQVDELRGKMSKMSLVDVYISEIPPISEELLPISDQARLDEVAKVTNLTTKREKIYVWNVLEYALKNSLDLDIDKINISKNENGKLKCQGCEISISHSKGLVAVAIGHIPVGIDIESSLNTNPSIMDKILTDTERSVMLNKLDSNRLLTYLWTRKESIFKRLDQKEFNPKAIDTTVEKVKTFEVPFKDNYILSVSNAFIDKVEFYMLAYGQQHFDNKKIELKEIKE